MTFSIFRDTIPNIDRENSAIEILLFGVFYERMMIMKKVLKLLSCSVLLGMCCVGSTGGMNPPPAPPVAPPPPPPPPGGGEDEEPDLEIEKKRSGNIGAGTNIGDPTISPADIADLIKKKNEKLEYINSFFISSKDLDDLNQMNDNKTAFVNGDREKEAKDKERESKGKYETSIYEAFDRKDLNILGSAKVKKINESLDGVITGFSPKFKQTSVKNFVQKEILSVIPESLFNSHTTGVQLVKKTDEFGNVFYEKISNKLKDLPKLKTTVNKCINGLFKSGQKFFTCFNTAGFEISDDQFANDLWSNEKLYAKSKSSASAKFIGINLFGFNSSGLQSDVKSYVTDRATEDLDNILGFNLFLILNPSIPEGITDEFHKIFIDNMHEFFRSDWEYSALLGRSVFWALYPGAIYAFHKKIMSLKGYKAAEEPLKSQISALYNPSNLVLPEQIDVAHVRKDLLASKLWHFFLDEHPEIKLTGEQIKALVEYAPVVAWTTVGKIKVDGKDPKQLTELITIKAGDVNLSEKVNNYLKNKNGDITLGDAVDHLNNQTAEAVKDYDSYFE